MNHLETEPPGPLPVGTVKVATASAHQEAASMWLSPELHSALSEVVELKLGVGGTHF